ncbi:hypothetical protein [Luteolibacter luteus]|uniref:Uncharacterized protein n=1 Tax=Luteolibacter luteus TaxID=2728835 RepID=A0A858RLY7_9BACT|nr:hypothetical protein [Luteolibacter luteus]QJE97977.1 hypothetical protein HHL09_20025 [Luteolibacter luteus]
MNHALRTPEASTQWFQTHFGDHDFLSPTDRKTDPEKQPHRRQSSRDPNYPPSFASIQKRKHPDAFARPAKAARICSGSNLVVFRDLAENPVAAFASLIHITRFQRKSEAFRSGIRLVDREVTPPDTPIVPEVMIGILLINSKRELGFAFHAF